MISTLEAHPCPFNNHQCSTTIQKLFCQGCLSIPYLSIKVLSKLANAPHLVHPASLILTAVIPSQVLARKNLKTDQPETRRFFMI
jgi:hypothetical protein